MSAETVPVGVAFARDALERKYMLEKFEQESVIVEIQNRGVVVDVYELTP
jgi:hypothetical protein